MKRSVTSNVGLRTLAALLVVNVLNFVDRQLPAILAEHIKRDLALSDTELGVLTGLAFTLVYGFAAVPLARLSDRWSARNVLAAAAAFWSVMTGLGAGATSFLQLALTRTGVALGEAATTPSTHAIISRLFPASQRGRAIGIVSTGASIGVMLGMALGGWLSDTLDWRSALLSVGGLGLVVAAGAAFLIPDLRHAAVGTRSSAPGYMGTRRLLRDRTYCLMLLAMCLYGLAAYSFLGFTAPFFIRLHGLSASEVGLTLGAVLGITGLVGTVLGGALFDRAIRRSEMNPLLWPAAALIAAAPATTAAWFAPNSALALALLVPFALAITFYAPALFGSAHLIAGPGSEATASSLLMIAAGLVGGTLGPLAIGAISDHWAAARGPDSLRFALLVVPALGAAAGVVLLLAGRRVGMRTDPARLSGDQGDSDPDHSRL